MIVMSSSIPVQSLSFMIAIYSVTYPHNKDVIILNLSSIWSFIIEILLSYSVFYSKISLFDLFQYLITETSTWNYVLNVMICIRTNIFLFLLFIFLDFFSFKFFFLFIDNEEAHDCGHMTCHIM